MATAGGEVTSMAPALLNISSAVSTTNSAVAFTGAAGLGKSGAGTYTIGRAMPSTGAVEVYEGVLEFIDSGSWRNGTNVVVGGTGVLKLSVASVFNRKSTVRLSDSGTLNIGSGADQLCRELIVGGVSQSPGVYAAMNSTRGGVFKTDRIVGDGTLTVTGRGCVLIYR